MENVTGDMSESKTKSHRPKSWIILLVLGIVGIIGGVICALVVFLMPEEVLPDLAFPTIPSKTETTKYYSKLTGAEVADEASLSAPTYCIQTPNGTDGARPQAGMHEAGVVFEAIAEAGITRFAAIYQAPTSAVIGPIRSLRLYYLQWDTPFDCTIVHAGGAYDALMALKTGGYKDLTENYTYMYRGNNWSRLWNNLFTTGTYLAQFGTDHGYATSNVQGFTRMTPEEALKARVDANVAEKLVITEPATSSTSTLTASVGGATIRFGWSPTFNVRYNYNPTTNSYDRSYESGDAHSVYDCPRENLGEVDPENTCALRQLSPSVVVVMMVEEKKASDNYHEDITAIGSGAAYIFQNGGVVTGTWRKGSVNEQIRFYDANSDEIALVPGQTFVEAVPNYGSVEY